MTKTLPALMVATLLSACATPGDNETTEKSARPIGVAQMGSKQNAEFVFCQEAECPSRSRKVLHVEPPPPPPPKPPVQAAQVAEPHTTVPVRFKIHFRWGWSRLDQSGRAELAKVVMSPDLKTAKSIVVAGRTDPTGGRKANEKLALKRAMTIRAALIEAGAPESVVVAEAQNPCCDGDAKAGTAVMQELRRTDIDITITK